MFCWLFKMINKFLHVIAFTLQYCLQEHHAILWPKLLTSFRCVGMKEEE